MPIVSPFSFRDYSQSEFGEIAYDVIGYAIEVHREVSNLVEERVCSKALAACLGNRAASEVRVSLLFDAFSKDYFLDLVVDGGAVFELKKVDLFSQKHRGQVLVYLMITETSHGKLINFRGSGLKHEFVNCLLPGKERRKFEIDTIDPGSAGGVASFQDCVIELLRDWGTGLEPGLYEDAVAFCVADPDQVDRHSIKFRGKRIGCLGIPMIDQGTALKITALKESDQKNLVRHARRLLDQTSLTKILWANVRHGRVRFEVIA